MRFSQVTSLLLCCVSSVGLSLGTSACFVDSRPDEGPDDEDGTTGDDTTGAGPASGISASATASQSSTSPTSPATTNPATTADTASDASSGTTTGGQDDTTDGSSSDASTGTFALSVDELDVGDLIITEVMNNPNCDADACEWIEVYNATQSPVDLQGLGVGDREDAETNSPDGLVASSVVVAPGGLAVLVRQADAWPYAIEYDAEYGTNVAFTNNGLESAAIFSGNDEVLDETTTFFSQDLEPGRSLSLQPEHWDVGANDNSDNWCQSDTLLESSDFSDDHGTPGAPDVLCAIIEK